MTWTDDAAYLTDRGPGSGRRSPARARVETDAPTLSLDGEWAFRLLPAAPGTLAGRDVLPDGEAPEAFASPGYDAAGWESIPVPAHWVLTGDGTRGLPAYTNVQFPFATEPPFVPDENPTGDHRRTFALPESFTSMERVLLRFDGVESRYRVWLNGTDVGVGAGSRLAQEFDVTGMTVPGENVLAVRVHQWSAGSYLEDQDQWWLPGIFRSVTLLGRPTGAIDDVWLTTPFHGAVGAPGPATVLPELVADARAFPVTFSVPELGVEATWQGPEDVAAVELKRVEPWSAETPRLYDATVMSTGERVSLRLGFRSVRIDGDRFLANGRRVVFHGVNRHEIHADLGRVFDEEFARRDLQLMKRMNVNAIRTSHYPPHPRMLDLADELGFWVMLENDLETHGFERDDWAENPSDDPAWHDACLDRMIRTVERDKNHPSVVIWSLGNEAGTGQNLAAIAAWVHGRDPGRPVHYEGDYTGVYTDLYSRMYAPVEEVAAIGAGDPSVRLLGCSAAEAARQRAKPFLLCEYVHAMGNGPGAIDDYEALVDAHPRLHGGFVWEWRDHGLRARTPGGTPYFAYGGDFGETVHDENFVMDGMVLTDGTPSPGLHEWAQVVAPVRLHLDRDGASVRLRVENRRHSADLVDIALDLVVEHDGVESQRGTLSPGALEPGGVVEVALPELPTAERGETWVTVRAVLAAATAWAPAGHAIGAAQLDLTPAAALRAIPTLTVREREPDAPSASARRVLGPAEFVHGRLVALGGRPVAGPRLELWRAPTDNDRGALEAPRDRDADVMRDRHRGDVHLRGTYPSSEDRWRREGLHRTVGRLEEVCLTEHSVRVRTRYASASSLRAVTVEEAWTLVGKELRLALDLIPTSGWDTTWPRVGVRFDLPLDVSRASWFGTGPRESYPDSRRAAFVGRFESAIDDLTVDYARPQESGHRSDLRRLDLVTSDGLNWLRIAADRDSAGRLPGFTLRRHTAQQVDAAAHPHELPVPVSTHLWLDAAQHGLGSRACGPDVSPAHALRPSSRSLRLRFTAL